MNGSLESQFSLTQQPVFRNVFGTQFDAYPEESLEAQISSSICDTWGVCSPFAYFIDRDMETQRLINPQMNKVGLSVPQMGISSSYGVGATQPTRRKLNKDRNSHDHGFTDPSPDIQDRSISGARADVRFQLRCILMERSVD